jgi:hypothetical protein
MMKNIGIEIPQEVYDILKTEKSFCFLTTYTEKGTPHLTPVHLLYPKNRESIVFAILNNHPGYLNMVWQKKALFSVFQENNTVCHLLCRAGILRAPSRVHPLMHIAQIDIIDVVEEQTLFVSIESGIQWKYISEDAKTLGEALMKEIHECIEYS